MNKVYVSVTIDVENPQTPLFEKRFSDNRIWSNGYGIEKIVATLNNFGIVGSFFVDVYEYPVWGRTAIKKVLKYIHDNGQDVELHTHPIWIDEKRRENMFQFPLREQVDIIRFGLDFIGEAINKRPICHRAGAYGFDQNTIEACELNNIIVESSNFFNHPNCKVIVTQNEIVKNDKMIEAPITFYEKDGQIIKTDINWIEEGDFWIFYENLKQNAGLNFVNLFLHSYSFTQTTDNYKSYLPSEETVQKFERILKQLNSDPDCEIVPLSQLPEVVQQTEKKMAPGQKVSVSTNSNLPNICHIGGAHSIQLRDLVRELDMNGYKQCVLTYSNAKKNLIQENVNVYYFPFNTYSSTTWQEQNYEKKLENLLGEIIKKEKVDLIHGHKLEASCIPTWMSKVKFNLPTIISPHNVLFLNYKKDSPEYLHTEKCLKSADRIAPGQPFVIKSLQKVYNLKSDKFSEGGIYPVYFSNFESNFNSKPYPTILSARQVGGEQYAQHLIVEAFPKVLAEFPDTKLILLIGHSVEQGRETFERLKVMVKEKQLEKNVEFIPYVLSLSELNKLIVTSDIVMSLNSLDHGMAATTISAAYLGAITFVSKTDLPSDIIDGENGFRVNHDPNEIGNKLNYALQNRNELRSKFFEINKDKLKKYAADKVIQQVINLYENVLSN